MSTCPVLLSYKLGSTFCDEPYRPPTTHLPRTWVVCDGVATSVTLAHAWHCWPAREGNCTSESRQLRRMRRAFERDMGWKSYVQESRVPVAELEGRRRAFERDIGWDPRDYTVPYTRETFPYRPLTISFREPMSWHNMSAYAYLVAIVLGVALTMWMFR